MEIKKKNLALFEEPLCRNRALPAVGEFSVTNISIPKMRFENEENS